MSPSNDWRGSTLARTALLVAFAVLVVARMPGVVVHGRLWAEEGRVFYAQAAQMPWWQALIQTYAGYLNLAANAAGVVVHAVVPLEWAAWATSAIGLALQCIPAVLVINAADAWLRPFWVRLAALVLIATPPLAEEVWLQTTTAQFHIALACALILALDVPRSRWPRLLVLALAPLCGPPALALLPLFMLRATIDRSRDRALQAAAMTFGAIIQMSLFYSGSGRPHGIGPFVLTCVVYIKQIVVPLAGRYVADEASTALQDALARGLVPWVASVATLGALIIVVVMLVRRGLPAATWLFLGGCASALIAYYGALDGGPHLLIIGNEGRYSFIPEVLGALALLGVASGTQKPERWAARILVAWLIAIGAVDCLDPSPSMKQGPDWQDEVAAWRLDHSHPIAIWPDGWFMMLDRP